MLPSKFQQEKELQHLKGKGLPQEELQVGYMARLAFEHMVTMNIPPNNAFQEMKGKGMGPEEALQTL